jgi:ubiquinone/menaquinone biosynthesis C-methylase UbiE
MSNNRKPQLVYTYVIAKSYEKDRRANVGDIAFWEKEKQELQFALKTSRLNISFILEAGCGTGRFLEDLVNKGYNVLGLDFSPFMLGQAKSKVAAKKPNCGLVRADISHVPVGKKPDFVYSIRVMNQLPSKEYAFSAVRELCQICKAPGAILLEFVNSRSLSLLSLRGATNFSVQELSSVIDENPSCKIVYVHGILFFSQTIWSKLPKLLLGPVSQIDTLISAHFPMLCTRCYVFITKSD